MTRQGRPRAPKGTTDHLLRDPDFKRFAKHVLDGTVPAMKDSAYVITVAPGESGLRDVKLAVETGFAILLDKPLIVLVPRGRSHVAPKLLRIADHVIEADMDTEEGRMEAQRKLTAILKQ